jgi:hypothetical protein
MNSKTNSRKSFGTPSVATTKSSTTITHISLDKRPSFNFSLNTPSIPSSTVAKHEIVLSSNSNNRNKKDRNLSLDLTGLINKTSEHLNYKSLDKTNIISNLKKKGRTDSNALNESYLFLTNDLNPGLNLNDIHPVSTVNSKLYAGFYTNSNSNNNSIKNNVNNNLSNGTYNNLHFNSSALSRYLSKISNKEEKKKTDDLSFSNNFNSNVVTDSNKNTIKKITKKVNKSFNSSQLNGLISNSLYNKKNTFSAKRSPSTNNMLNHSNSDLSKNLIISRLAASQKDNTNTGNNVNTSLNISKDFKGLNKPNETETNKHMETEVFESGIRSNSSFNREQLEVKYIILI